MKCFFLSIILCLIFLTGFAEDTAQKRDNEWQTNTYPKIGLQLKHRGWNADIEDQPKSWMMLAIPLVKNPEADVQYRLVVTIGKLSKEEHLRWFPKSGPGGWANSQHLEMSFSTNEFWIYCRKDIFSTNGFAYTCVGRIKRDVHFKAKDPNHLDKDDEALKSDLSEVFNSIKVLPSESNK